MALVTRLLVSASLLLLVVGCSRLRYETESLFIDHSMQLTVKAPIEIVVQAAEREFGMTETGGGQSKVYFLPVSTIQSDCTGSIAAVEKTTSRIFAACSRYPRNNAEALLAGGKIVHIEISSKLYWTLVRIKQAAERSAAHSEIHSNTKD